MEFGAPFVINPGITLMLEWRVLRWDTLQEVLMLCAHYCWHTKFLLQGYDYHGDSDSTQEKKVKMEVSVYYHCKVKWG